MPAKTKPPAKGVHLAKREDKGTALQLWTRLEDQIGKDRIAPVLEGSLDIRFQKLLRELTCPAPALQNKSIRQLATRNGISYHELVEAYRQSNLGMAIAKASEQVNVIMDDAVEDSKSRVIECIVCKGEKVVRKFKPDEDGEPELVSEEPCRACSGEGTVRKIGDIESRKLVFEAVGLTKRGSLNILNANVVNYGGPADESLEALIKDTDTVVDGTIIEVTQKEMADEQTPD